MHLANVRPAHSFRKAAISGQRAHLATARERQLLIISASVSTAGMGRIAVDEIHTYLAVMPSKQNLPLATDLIAKWPLPAAATLGSAVRAKGIVLEVRANLPHAVKKSLDVIGGTMVLRMRKDAHAEFRKASSVVARRLDGIENLPVIPREIEDILSISTTERHRWLKDGRLPSAGTRTVKLRGRAKKITFHVFDPRKVDEILNEDLVMTWREDDAIRVAENRRKAAWKAKLVKAEKRARDAGESDNTEAKPNLVGWEDFERDGLLR
jgi:hypothetical protein